MGRDASHGEERVVTQSQHDDRMIVMTLKHSPIGRPPKQRIYLHSLGLRRLHQTVRRPKTPQVLGLVDKVRHLIEVQET